MPTITTRFVSSALKHRPGRFGDVLAQEHVSRTLVHGLELGRIANAYLFSGPRGTGKTSMARILAKALNCENPDGVEPCGDCTQCRAITQGNHPDILEIDAASNRGIDHIRNLRENVRFTPSLGRKKVYIIDEVHMLSGEAFNALLKTLEEPPSHSTFVLATTELHKVPETILSRCQRFQMRRIPSNVVVERLKQVLQSEGGITFASEQDAERVLFQVAHASNGGLRDALVSLDQLIAFAGESLKADEVEDLLGVVDLDALHRLACAIWSGDLHTIVATIALLVERGREPTQILRELVVLVRHMMVIKITENPDLADVPQDVYEQLLASIKDIPVEKLLLSIEVLLEAEPRLRYSPEGRMVIEVACIKAAKLGETVALQEILEALAQNGGTLPPPPDSGRTTGEAISSTGFTFTHHASPHNRKTDSHPRAAGNESNVVELPIAAEALPAPVMAQPKSKLERVQVAWKEMIEDGHNFPPLLEASAGVAVPVRINDNKLVVGVPREYRKSMDPLLKPEHQQMIVRKLRELVGETFVLDVKLKDLIREEELPPRDVPPVHQEALESSAREHEAVKLILKHFPGEVLTVRKNPGGKKN